MDGREGATSVLGRRQPENTAVSAPAVVEPFLAIDISPVEARKLAWTRGRVRENQRDVADLLVPRTQVGDERSKGLTGDRRRLVGVEDKSQLLWRS